MFSLKEYRAHQNIANGLPVYDILCHCYNFKILLSYRTPPDRRAISSVLLPF